MYGDQNSIALWIGKIFGYNLDKGHVQLVVELLHFQSHARPFPYPTCDQTYLVLVIYWTNPLSNLRPNFSSFGCLLDQSLV